ncbi:MAG: ParB/RepB/Spo0J family partition protein, partial [Clostridia bacterium]|nr:ParB/RepB/Spo0J family partition protein [Clostridia bacterium]
MKKGGLGRGLDSLFDQNSVDKDSILLVKLSEIEPNKNQPRKTFDEKAIEELSNSIKEHGLLQPILVRPLVNGAYQIIAGERRWRACRMAELDMVPVIIKEMDDRKTMEVSIIENLQREDLNPVEEALGFKALIDTYGLTQEQVAERVGKSRSAITNALRLLGLSDKILESLREGEITVGHAKALLSAEESRRNSLLSLAVAGASVRQLEQMAKSQEKPQKKTAPAAKDKYYREVELALKSVLHRPVKITKEDNGRGTLSIEFYNNDELKDLAK